MPTILRPNRGGVNRPACDKHSAECVFGGASGLESERQRCMPGGGNRMDRPPLVWLLSRAGHRPCGTLCIRPITARKWRLVYVRESRPLRSVARCLGREIVHAVVTSAPSTGGGRRKIAPRYAPEARGRACPASSETACLAARSTSGGNGPPPRTGGASPV